MNNGSLYDFVGSEYSAPQQEEATPHANRQDLSKPYNGAFAQKAKEATTDSQPKTCANAEFWRWFTGQQTNNHIAVSINRMFKKIEITDYNETKRQYIETYNKELIK